MKKLRIIALTLAILCLLAPLTQTVSAAEVSNASNELASLDFSSFGDTTFLARISPADLLKTLLQNICGDDRPMSEAEQKYLDLYFEEYLTYDATLPASLLSIDAEGDRITVKAKSYSYQAKNGEMMTYHPVRVTMGNQTKTPTYSSANKCFVAELHASSESASVTVYYSGSVTLPKELINRLVTMAFDDATNALMSEDKMLQYTAALAEYQNYLRACEQYETDCLNYEAYLSRLELYRQAYAKYEENQKEWARYREKYSVYEAYLDALKLYDQKLVQYETDYASYLTQINARDAYLKNLNRIRTALVPMESLFLLPSDKKTGSLYRALQNSELVSMFEKYQSVLTKNFGIPKQTITDLRTDADHLNDLLGGYEEARTISEKEAFLYYQKNYNEICYLFNSLYERMSAIFAPPNEYSGSTVYTLVCGKLDAEYGKEEGSYKKWRIKNVLAHIYLICLCLDDTRVPEATWNFYSDKGEPHTYYFSNLLTQNLIISDSNAANPSSLSWLDEVAAPTPPQIPEKPTEVVEPIPPAAVQEPTPPTEVAKPTLPERVDFPSPPSESDYSLVLRTGEICLALQQGLLYHDRGKITEDPTITLPELSVEKRIEGVSIYGVYGCLLDETDPSSLPTPTEDSNTLPLSMNDGYDTYTFEGWSTAKDGSSISAVYRRPVTTYRATFVIDGAIVYETDVPAMQTPQFVGSTQKESTGALDYHFTTWDPPLSPIRENTVYVAQYREQARSYSIGFSILGQVITNRYAWQAIPTIPKEPPKYDYSEGSESLLVFEQWDRAVVPVTQDTVYTAQYREIGLPTLPESSNDTIVLRMNDQEVLILASEHRISQLSPLLEELVLNNCRLDVLFTKSNITLSLDAVALQALHNAELNELFLDQNETHGTAIRFFTSDGSEIFLNEGIVRLTLPHRFDDTANVYLSSYDPAQNRVQKSVSHIRTANALEAIVSPGTYYLPYERFSLTLNVGEHGQAMTNETIYSEGEAIYLTVHSDAHYRISALFLKNPITGEMVAIEKNNATMPAWNAILCVEFAPIEYTITFIYHGETKVETHTFGDQLVFPEIPTSFEENGFFYTFIGWSATASMVTEDAVYTANYYSLRVEDVADNGEGGAWETIIWKILLPLALEAILILAILIMTPILIVRQIKKKKKNKA